MSGWGSATAGILAARAATLAMNALTGVVLARQLAPSGRGTYYVLISVAIMAHMIGNLSIDQALVTRWQRAGERPALRANCLLLGPLLGMVAAGVAAVAATTLGSYDGESLAIALLAPAVVITSTLLAGVLGLDGRVALVAWGSFAGSATQFILLLALAGSGRLTVAAAVPIWVLSTVVPLALYLRGGVRLADADPALALRSLAVGARNHVGLVAIAVMLRVDLLMIDTAESARAAGLFSVATTLIDLVYVATSSLSLAALSRQATAEDGDAAEITARATRAAGLLGAGATLVLCGTAPVLIPLVYGADFRDSLAPLLGLAPGLLVFAATRPVWTHLLRLNRTGTATVMALSMFGLNVLLSLLLLPRFGALGCAIASSVSYGGFGLLQTAWFLRASGLPVSAVVAGPAEVRALLGALRRFATRRRRVPVA
ncbi:polysaccharide biosynthesis C-terminal domain-containing protein [Nonomuraea sp. NBC_01738]|uniref:lipopolysaccharide biosynthesis protein n=1 Tax=Nonomuraea sp. NBC_01738 TaxID=2976003 RepID=UPI002E10A4CA|nr:polysaccharide biosynthesis C-terminal domain-containing protein [Nonomuraea sp. NBC_01738]